MAKENPDLDGNVIKKKILLTKWEKKAFKSVSVDAVSKTLAFKFVPITQGSTVDREYRNYGGLEAITNSSVHRYGIPSLHFRGNIKIGSMTFDTIGVKLLEGDFLYKMEEEYKKCLGRWLDLGN